MGMRTSPELPLLPTYHVVVSQPSDYAYSVTEQQLASHLERIARRLGPAAGANPSPSLTFDDGHASQYRYAFPLLEKYRLRTIIFAIAGWMDCRPDYMTWSQLREFVAAGHEVQSHGLTHRFLTTCTGQELKEELEGSRNELQQKLGTPVDAISMPYGRMDQRVIEACLVAGYTRIYTSAPRTKVAIRGQGQVLGRYMVKRSTSDEELERTLNASRTALKLMDLRYEGKLLCRRVIGENMYHRLWGLWSSRRTLEEDVSKEY